MIILIFHEHNLLKVLISKFRMINHLNNQELDVENKALITIFNRMFLNLYKLKKNEVLY
jgi:hypothetical protein